jgi:dienelactone hydrolase
LFPSAVRPVILLIVLALSLAPARASAEVIDYDPATPPPAILGADDLARYDALSRIPESPAIVSPASPNGQYMIVIRTGPYEILDLDTRTFTVVPLEMWNPSITALVTPIQWVDETHAVCVIYSYAARGFQKLTLDAPNATVRATIMPLPTIPGKAVGMAGGPLLRTPDGAWRVLAYTQTPGTVLAIEPRAGYEVRTGAAREERVRLGTEPEVDAFLQTDEEMLALDIDTGEPLVIAPLPTGASIYRIASTMAQRPGTGTISYLVQIVPSCGGEVIRGRSCRGGGNPTGSFLVRESLGLVPSQENLFLTGTALHLVDLGTGAHTVIENDDYPTGRFADTNWTGDGSRLLVTVGVPSVLTDRRYPVYGTPADLAFMVFDPLGTFVRDWDPAPLVQGASVRTIDGTRIAIRTPVNLDLDLFVVDANAPDAPPQALLARPGAVYAYEIAGNLLVYLHGDVTLPGELYVAETRDVSATSAAVSDVYAGLKTVSRIAYQPIAYRTSGGYDVEGIYIYPAEWPFPPPEPGPVVVWQLGGPGGQMVNSWATSVENPYSLLPSFGLPVFMVNASGRLSNGPRFYSDMADGRNFGHRDIRDVKEGVDYLVAHGIADPARVGVTGCSYGGYFTLQSLVEYPDVYKAGNAQCSLNDLLYEYNFGWAYTIAYLMGRSPIADPAEYVKDSPLYRSYQVKAPLLIFHGTNDFLPHEHMVNFHDQVVANGVPARMLRVAGEGHGLGEANSQRYAAQLQIDWFRQYLAGATGLQTLPVWPRQPVLPRTVQFGEVIQ